MHVYIRIVYYVFLKGMCETISVLKGSDQDLIERLPGCVCLFTVLGTYIYVPVYALACMSEC